MTDLDILHQRLFNQHLLGTPFENPVEAVRWLGAVQAQDYPGAKWAVGQRTKNSSDAEIERLFTDGSILRTHVLRPTWHLVTAEDIRWMVALTGPRVIARLTHAYRVTDLEYFDFAKSNEALAKGMQGGKQLTRAELVGILQQVGIPTENLLRTSHILMRAELDGIMVSGGMRGKQHTYSLLDERAPNARSLSREEALGELARRFFLSHGPATLKDYVWWSGLTTADAKAGLEMIKPHLTKETVDGETYWLAETTPVAQGTTPTVLMLSNYDEFIVAYTDRSHMFDEQHKDKLDSRGNVLFNHTIVIDGRIVGTWKRTLKKSTVVVATTLFSPLPPAENEAFTAAAQRYGEFLGLSIVLA